LILGRQQAPVNCALRYEITDAEAIMILAEADYCKARAYKNENSVLSTLTEAWYEEVFS